MVGDRSHLDCAAFGGHSEVDRLVTAILQHPKDAFVSQDNLDREWQRFAYTARPDFHEACREYDRFVSLLHDCGVETLFLHGDEDTGIDSIYVRDSAVVTDRGIVLGHMGKPHRRGEPEALASALARMQIPIAGRISDPGTLEGGDFIWVDQTTMAVARGYRTNDAGIAQLEHLTTGLAEAVVVVHLPHWDGPGGLLHLMSLISPLDRDLAVVYSRLLPVAFREWLVNRGMSLIEVPDEEFESMGCNVLAVAPRKCVMLEGNPRTRELLERAGVDVLTYTGREISLKGLGGPTCLTRPVYRSPAD